MTDEIFQRVASEYYASLRHKTIRQPLCLILFSGVPGSGKTTIARIIEHELHAIRISNDEIRNCIIAAEPSVQRKDQEQAKFRIGNAVLDKVAEQTDNLIVLDASCDRGYNEYEAWAKKHTYRIVLVRLDIPREIIEQRLRERGQQQTNKMASNYIANLDAWWHNGKISEKNIRQMWQ